MGSSPAPFDPRLIATIAMAPDGSLRVASEDTAPTYRVSTGLFPIAANATDFFAIGLASYGRATSVKKIVVSGVSTSGGTTLRVRLQKSHSGGLPAGQYTNPFFANSDQNDTFPATLIYAFTANRTSNGDGVSSSRPMLDEKELTLGVAGTSSGTPVEFDFTSGNAKCPTIKQLSDWLVGNLNGQTIPAGTQMRVTVHVQEQRVFRVAAVGDSTTSNATSGYLNHGADNGGIGTSGLFNGKALIDNLGSNGFRLYDFINNLNGVSYPMSQIMGMNHDWWNFCYGINDTRTGLIGVDQPSATNRLTSLIDTAIYGALNGATAGQVYVSPKATSDQIQSITWSSGVATVTTNGNHHFGSSETCVASIAGVTPAGYNTAANIAVTGPNTFTYPLASNPGAYTNGGTATFATIWSATWAGLPDLKIILWGPNSFTADDAGDGPHYFMSASGNTTLSGIWAGMTLAQAAQAASNILYNAYASFAGDPRIFALVQKQDTTFGRTVVNNANTPLMLNQLHPNARGQVLETRALMPTMLAVMNSLAAWMY